MQGNIEKLAKNLAHRRMTMYRKPSTQMKIEDFILPFEGKLNPENRWVKLSKVIPWEKIEENYAQLFPSGTGTEAKPLRMALGSLLSGS